MKILSNLTINEIKENEILYISLIVNDFNIKKYNNFLYNFYYSDISYFYEFLDKCLDKIILNKNNLSISSFNFLNYYLSNILNNYIEEHDKFDSHILYPEIYKNIKNKNKYYFLEKKLITNSHKLFNYFFNNNKLYENYLKSIKESFKNEKSFSYFIMPFNYIKLSNNLLDNHDYLLLDKTQNILKNIFLTVIDFYEKNINKKYNFKHNLDLKDKLINEQKNLFLKYYIIHHSINSYELYNTYYHKYLFNSFLKEINNIKYENKQFNYSYKMEDYIEEKLLLNENKNILLNEYQMYLLSYYMQVFYFTYHIKHNNFSKLNLFYDGITSVNKNNLQSYFLSIMFNSNSSKTLDKIEKKIKQEKQIEYRNEIIKLFKNCNIFNFTQITGGIDNNINYKNLKNNEKLLNFIINNPSLFNFNKIKEISQVKFDNILDNQEKKNFYLEKLLFNNINIFNINTNNLLYFYEINKKHVERNTINEKIEKSIFSPNNKYIKKVNKL